MTVSLDKKSATPRSFDCQNNRKGGTSKPDPEDKVQKQSALGILCAYLNYAATCILVLLCLYVAFSSGRFEMHFFGFHLEVPAFGPSWLPESWGGFWDFLILTLPSKTEESFVFWVSAAFVTFFLCRIFTWMSQRYNKPLGTLTPGMFLAVLFIIGYILRLLAEAMQIDGTSLDLLFPTTDTYLFWAAAWHDCIQWIDSVRFYHENFSLVADISEACFSLTLFFVGLDICFYVLESHAFGFLALLDGLPRTKFQRDFGD